LIEHAKQGGGADNITCMMLRVVEAAPADIVEPAVANEPVAVAEEIELTPPSIEP
jgi:serine/threonine protein phosphatase PrpC